MHRPPSLFGQGSCLLSDAHRPWDGRAGGVRVARLLSRAVPVGRGRRGEAAAACSGAWSADFQRAAALRQHGAQTGNARDVMAGGRSHDSAGNLAAAAMQGETCREGRTRAHGRQALWAGRQPCWAHALDGLRGARGARRGWLKRLTCSMRSLLGVCVCSDWHGAQTAGGSAAAGKDEQELTLPGHSMS